ncbi:hypothetical protein AOQ84DRAFT_42490 [Glonium stellatum]|uniref:Uncharacterized protein n=1 Tax=Glonium stellatum TaxID=574774 RepID=A0A8E2FD74_9PEZI|nr:hypothetical protein AOQ84DRAFT_42490 [Glonium stellatum]
MEFGGGVEPLSFIHSIKSYISRLLPPTEFGGSVELPLIIEPYIPQRLLPPTPISQLRPAFQLIESLSSGTILTTTSTGGGKFRELSSDAHGWLGPRGPNIAFTVFKDVRKKQFSLAIHSPSLCRSLYRAQGDLELESSDDLCLDLTDAARSYKAWKIWLYAKIAREDETSRDYC